MSDPRVEAIRTACAEIGIPVASGSPFVRHDGTQGVHYKVPLGARAAGRRALALALIREGQPLMFCIRHTTEAKRPQGCDMVTVTEVLRDPTIACGAP